MHFVPLFRLSAPRLPSPHVPPALLAAAPALLECAVISTALIAILILFFSLKREIQIAVHNSDQRVRELAARLWESEELTLEAREASDGEWTERSLAPQFRSGFNLNKRVQAIRLLRRGEDQAHVSAALGVPRKEVELLVRLQNMGANAGSAVGPGSAISLFTGADGKYE